MKTTILNVPIDTVSRGEALQRLLFFLGEEKNHLLVTPNPEMVMKAQKDKKFMEILQNADLVVPDGIGLVLASKLGDNKIHERVAGCDLILALFDVIKDMDISAYLLGSAPGVALEAKKNMEKKFKNLRICGVHDGYFNEEEEKQILSEIEALKPELLLVGLGSPRQEKWMYKHRNLPVRVSAGVGGSIDVMSGRVTRAPMVFQRLGLEWFYRLISQPKRIFRMGNLPLFVLAVLREKWREKLRGGWK